MAESYRIAHLLASNFFGGPEKQLVEHACRISERNIEPRIISFVEEGNANQLLERAKQRGIVTTSICLGSFDVRQICILIHLLRTEQINLICIHGYKANIIGRIASWGAGIPLVAISRGWTGEDRKIRLYEWLDRMFLRLADHVVAVSAGQQKKILACGVSQDKVTVIHNAINLSEFPEAGDHFLRCELGLPDDAIIVASAGRLSPEKNYATMIEASHDLIKNNLKIYFAVFGEGFLRQKLEAQIAAAGLAGRFLLPGFRTDLQRVMHDIDIFMLPSFTEGLPNVVLEAFAARKPVVATRVGGTPEVVQDGISGFLTRPDEPELMARHLQTLADNSILRQEMGQAGYAYTKEYFSFTTQTEAYERLYTGLLQSKKWRH